MIRFTCDDGKGLGLDIVNAETGESITKILSVNYGGTIRPLKDDP